jgi:HD-like signal output (HDOD) protein
MGRREIGQLLERVAELDTLPEVTQRILALSEDPDSSAHDMNEVLKHDTALSTKLLRVVNSAFYGLPGRVADVDRAIVLLGFQAVRNLAIAATMSAMFRKPGTEIRGFSARNLWQHSVATAVAARAVVNTVGLRSLREEAFLAGIVHDVGILVEYQFAGKQFALVMEGANGDAATLTEAERAVFEMNHQEIGKALAEQWKFPKNMQMVAGYHHRPGSLAEEHRLLPTVVGIAGEVAESCGYRFLDFAAEGDPQDWDALAESVNLEPEDRKNVCESLPEMVEQASGWLDS